MLQRLGLKDGEAITHPWVNKALEKAQQKVEARNFEIRKNLLRFDNVMNDQRKVIYEQRKEIMNVPEVAQMVADMRHEVIADMVRRAIPPNSYAEQWDMKGLHDDCRRVLGLDLPVADWAKEEGIAEPEIEERVRQASDRKMAEKAANLGADIMRMAEKSLLLQILDQSWKDHLLMLDHLRQGINLRAYAQRDPLREYQAEAFDLFQRMLSGLREQVTQVLSLIELRVSRPEELAAVPAMGRPRPQEIHETRQDPALAAGHAVPTEAPLATGTYGAAAPPASGAVTAAAAAVRGRAAAVGDGPAAPQRQTGGVTTVRRTPPPGTQVDPKDPETWGKVPRNAPCPCGSGKKYKHCHGALG
jgi:preprotein translocase subunit SecA